MTGINSYLIDYQDIDGGFVAFAGSHKGVKITRKGKIRTRKLDFEDVYFVKELKFKLFSVSQICDKKNSVLFSETEWSGPEWLFDIDSLTKSMNYEPVTAGNQTNGDAGIETNVNAGQAGQEKTSDHEYILLPLMLSNSTLSLSSQSIDNKDADEVPKKEMMI
ncbi:hypothetical protein Tco_1463598 [Tanacetum coccineum]